MARISEIYEAAIKGNVEEITLVTHHPKPMHCDEVTATALLNILFRNKAKTNVHFSFKPAEEGYTDETPNCVVYDVGNGIYDHHQDEQRLVRLDGGKYAASGLVWQEIAPLLGLDEKRIAEIYNNLVKYIDDQDNGNGWNPLSLAFKAFNDLEGQDEKEKFGNAVITMTMIIQAAIDSAKHKMEVEKDIISAIEKRTCDNYVVTDNYLPGMSEQLSKRKIPFYIYPSTRGGWVFSTVPSTPGAQQGDYMVPIPSSVKHMTGITFLHVSGFMGVAETKEKAIETVLNIIANQKENNADYIVKQNKCVYISGNKVLTNEHPVVYAPKLDIEKSEE